VTKQDAPVTKLLTDFKKFLFRGNVVDLAVAVVVGTAFTALVKSLVTDLFTPLIAAIFGAHDFSALKFRINSSTFAYGDFINNVITFLSVATVVFFLVVAPLTALMSRRAEEDPDTKQCPECDSAIPVKARRCPECTSQLVTAD
jgi:large conductance mechanosensitive channel